MMHTPSYKAFGAPAAVTSRVDWVDYAKGICILLVVMFHTVNHYEAAVGDEGWMRWIVDFSKPFRMPDFFLISGLFLSRTINTNLARYLDKKVVHFAYFYLLWLGLTLFLTDNDTLRSNPVEFAKLYLWNIVQPTGVLWFVHMLAVFYVITRAVRRAPQWAVFAVAAALHVAHQAQWIDTPSYAINRAMDYYVFFFIGYAAHKAVFSIADGVAIRPWAAGLTLVSWAIGQYVLTRDPSLQLIPGAPLLMGVAGAIAICEIAKLLSMTRWAGFLRYCGRHSIVIYLTFLFPMTALERTLPQFSMVLDTGFACLIILVISTVLPLFFHRAIKGTPLIALYVRPKMFRFGSGKERWRRRRPDAQTYEMSRS
jgi:uncharacterized membrane protein YcfT